MEKSRACRIGRYEAVKTENRIEIFDMQSEEKYERGKQQPIKVIPLDKNKTEREGCLMAIDWLRKNGQIDASDFYRHVDAFMGSDSVDGR